MATATPHTQLDHQITGDPKSGTLLIFLHGWPDQMDMWDQYMLVDTTFAKYRVLKINMPNAGKQKIAWGQDFQTLAERVKATIDSVSGVSRRILVCHDWGCIYGYLVDQSHPKYFEQIIAMDVPGMTQVTSLRGRLFVFAYQITLIIAFLIARVLKCESVGDAITRSMSKLFGHKPPYFNQIKAERNYPYYYFWKNMIQSKLHQKKKLLAQYVPSVPVVYMYGAKKSFMFHGPKWINFLRETEGCEIHPINDLHWFMKDFKSFVNDTIIRRIEK